MTKLILAFCNFVSVPKIFRAQSVAFRCTMCTNRPVLLAIYMAALCLHFAQGIQRNAEAIEPVTLNNALHIVPVPISVHSTRMMTYSGHSIAIQAYI
jgi:hypothetical protein